MAGTSLRRWTVLPVMLVALLATHGYGDELPITTYQSDGDEEDPGQLWRCPKCGRVERVQLVDEPRCPGNPRGSHLPKDAIPVSEEDGFAPEDDLPLFE